MRNGLNLVQDTVFNMLADTFNTSSPSDCEEVADMLDELANIFRDFGIEAECENDES